MDPATDIALLRVVKPDREFDHLALGDSAAVRVGQWVMAAGNPLEMEHSVTVGVVSAKGRALGLVSRIELLREFHSDRCRDQLRQLRRTVWLTCPAMSSASTPPSTRPGRISVLRSRSMLPARILPQLRERGRVVRGYLGVSINNLNPGEAEAFGLDSSDGALGRIGGFRARS